MNATRTGIVLGLAGMLALPALADDVYYDTARVLSVTPQTERIYSPREECHTTYEHQPYHDTGRRDIGGAILGGVAGGLIGSQIGKGSGRVAGAAVGAATGAIIGDRIDNGDRHAHASRPVERCVTVDDWETVSRGYLVSYRYHGRDYTTTLPYDPGKRMPVRVSVAPDFDGGKAAYLVPGHPAGDDDTRRRDWD